LGELIHLEELRWRRLARAAFARWPQRLGYQPPPKARLSHLPDLVVGFLAELRHLATLALYDVVLGVRGLGPGERFHYLEAEHKVEALDAFLFLTDQVRFELMRRLGWVEGLAAEHYPIVELAARAREIRRSFRPEVPRLTPAYPRYQEVARRLKIEPGAVVRSLIPEALRRFRRRISGG